MVAEMSAKKAVITAVGLGIKLVPVSKELPKEMLPVYLKGISGRLFLSLYFKLYLSIFTTLELESSAS